MYELNWKRGFLSAEFFDKEQHPVAKLDRPITAGGWVISQGDERFLVRRPHWFAREYQVTRERTGELVATVYLPLMPMRRVARITLMPEQQVYMFRYTNFWKRHFRLYDPGEQVCVQTADVSLFGWTGKLHAGDGTPVLVVLLSCFAYLRMAIRRRAARS